MSNLLTPETKRKFGVGNAGYDEKNRELIKQFRKTKDERLFEEFLELNLPLIRKMAGKFSYNNPMMFDDLIQVGRFAALKVIDDTYKGEIKKKSFDLNSEVAVSSYLAITLRNEMLRTLCSDGHFIYIPNHVSELITKIIKGDYDFSDPSIIQKICRDLRISTSWAQKAISVIFRINTLVYLDEEVGDNDFTREDTFPELRHFDSNNLINEKLLASLNKLPERLRLVIYRRFFCDYTYEQTGEELGVTRERSRQLTLDAIKLLRKDLGKIANTLYEFENGSYRARGGDDFQKHNKKVRTKKTKIPELGTCEIRVAMFLWPKLDTKKPYLVSSKEIAEALNITRSIANTTVSKLYGCRIIKRIAHGLYTRGRPKFIAKIGSPSITINGFKIHKRTKYKIDSIISFLKNEKRETKQ